MRPAARRAALIAACLSLLQSCENETLIDASAPGNAPAARVVSLAPNLTEILFAVGAENRIVGVVEYSDYPEAAKALPRIGDAFRLDYEAIAGLEPDLILGWASGNPQRMFDRLRALGYRVVTFEPTSLDSIADHVRIVGALTGQDATAARVAANFEARLAGLRQRYRDASPVRVLYQVSERPLLTVNGTQIIGRGIVACGGVNIFADVDSLTPAISIESVLEREPEAIIAGMGPGDSRDPFAVWREWTTLPAVRDGNLFTVDANLTGRASMRFIDGAEEICARLDDARRNSGR